MTAVVAIICFTVLALAVVIGVLVERHKRFWLERNVDDLQMSLAAIRKATEVKDATIEALEKRLRDLEAQRAFRG